MNRYTNNKQALVESKKVIEWYLDNPEEMPDSALKAISNLLNQAECLCDDYNGFSCGCETRKYLSEIILKK